MQKWMRMMLPPTCQLVVLPFCNDFKEELLEAVSGQDLDQVNQVLGRNLESEAGTMVFDINISRTYDENKTNDICDHTCVCI